VAVWGLWRFGACGDLGRVAVWGVWPFGVYYIHAGDEKWIQNFHRNG